MREAYMPGARLAARTPPVIPLWRLTRNRYTRRLYDGLAGVGITVSRMVEYVADVQDPSAENPRAGAGSVSADVSFKTVPATDGLAGRLDFSIPVTYLDGEWVIVAVANGDPVGRALVSAGHQPYVEALGQRLSVEGAYVRRVYVRRDWRNHGLAGRLVSLSRTVAAEQFDTESAHAVIAPDNVPSRAAFEANGFEPVRTHDYVSLFGREWRRSTER